MELMAGLQFGTTSVTYRLDTRNSLEHKRTANSKRYALREEELVVLVAQRSHHEPEHEQECAGCDEDRRSERVESTADEGTLDSGSE